MGENPSVEFVPRTRELAREPKQRDERAPARELRSSKKQLDFPMDVEGRVEKRESERKDARFLFTLRPVGGRRCQGVKLDEA